MKLRTKITNKLITDQLTRDMSGVKPYGLAQAAVMVVGRDQLDAWVSGKDHLDLDSLAKMAAIGGCTLSGYFDYLETGYFMPSRVTDKNYSRDFKESVRALARHLGKGMPRYAGGYATGSSIPARIRLDVAIKIADGFGLPLSELVRWVERRELGFGHRPERTGFVRKEATASNAKTEAERKEIIAQAQKKKRAGRTAYGFKRDENGKIIKCSYEQTIIEFVRSYHRTGETATKTANDLNKLGYRNRNKGKFTGQSLHTIISKFKE